MRKRLIHELNPFYKIPFEELTAELMPENVFLDIIKKRFAFQGDAKYSIAEISTDLISPLTNFVYGFRLDKAKKLLSKYIEAKIEPFKPIFLNYRNEYLQMIAPPVLEIHNNQYVLCDGTHRVYQAIKSSYKNIYCLVIENKKIPLPGDVNNWSNVKFLENEVQVQNNFINFKPEFLSGYTWIFNSNKTWIPYDTNQSDLTEILSS